MKTTPDHLRPRRAKEESEATNQPSDVTVPRFRIRPSMLAGIALATGVALHSPEAEGTETITCTTSSTPTISCPSGGYCGSYTPSGYFIHEPSVRWFEGEIYLGDTSTPVTVTDYEEHEFEDLIEVEGKFYAVDRSTGKALELTCSGTTCTATELGHGGGYGSTPFNGTHYESEYHSTTGNYAIFAVGATTPTWSDSSDHLRWPATVDYAGNPDTYMLTEQDDGVTYEITLRNMSTGDTFEIVEGIRPTGQQTAADTFVVWSTMYDGSAYNPYPTTCTISTISTSTCYADADSDGFGDPSVSEEDVEECSPGYVANSTDCDDTDPFINPDADEECDSVDNDCDGDIDEDSAVDAPTWYEDNDGDGYGTTADTTRACSRPSGFAPTSDDCDDANAGQNPGETEVAYDGVDNDCDPSTSDDDLDRDGYPLADDCDDTNSAINPDADERCDGVDNDCDGDTDEDDAVDAELWYADNDGDNYGTGDPVLACNAPTGYSAEDGDCDDDSSVTYPDAPELCDEIDNDCDEVVDNDVTYVDWYLDSDEDGFGDPATGISSCEDLSWDGYVTNDEDCDDDDYYVNPDATEVYDGVDNNCDGNTDLTDPTCEVIWTNCDDSAASLKGVGDLMTIMAPEDCIIEYTIAKGVEEGTCAYSYLDRSTSVEMFFDGIDSSGYYVTEITSEKGVIDFTSEGAETEIFEGADGYFFGHSGSGRIIEKDGYMMTGTVTAPTINLVHDVNGGDVYKEDLEELARMTSEGDVAVVNTQDGTFEINPDENPDDTGETDDTGITTPPDGCPGCSSAKTVNEGLLLTGLAVGGVLGLAGVRRRRYQPELDGYRQ